MLRREERLSGGCRRVSPRFFLDQARPHHFPRAAADPIEGQSSLLRGILKRDGTSQGGENPPPRLAELSAAVYTSPSIPSHTL